MLNPHFNTILRRLAWLAMLAVLAQATVPAVCCCERSVTRSASQESISPAVCCCCCNNRATRAPSSDCCHGAGHGASESPCNCPCGCCSKPVDQAPVEPLSPGHSKRLLENLRSVSAAITSVEFDLVLAGHQTAVVSAEHTLSAADACSMLCRFLL